MHKVIAPFVLLLAVGEQMQEGVTSSFIEGDKNPQGLVHNVLFSLPFALQRKAGPAYAGPAHGDSPGSLPKHDISYFPFATGIGNILVFPFGNQALTFNIGYHIIYI